MISHFSDIKQPLYIATGWFSGQNIYSSVLVESQEIVQIILLRKLKKIEQLSIVENVRE